MSNYGNRFVKLLSEKDEMSDEEAMTQTLDKGTEVKDFDVEGVQPGVAPVPTMGAVQKKMYDDLTGWINELDRFTEYLNGTGPDSVQTKLNSAEPDTLFDKIATAETKKIARVSVELSSLSQMFKGYVATANDSKYRFQ